MSEFQKNAIANRATHYRNVGDWIYWSAVTAASSAMKGQRGITDRAEISRYYNVAFSCWALADGEPLPSVMFDLTRTRLLNIEDQVAEFRNSKEDGWPEFFRDLRAVLFLITFEQSQAKNQMAPVFVPMSGNEVPN